VSESLLLKLLFFSKQIYTNFQNKSLVLDSFEIKHPFCGPGCELERKNFFFCIEFKYLGFCRVQPAQLWLAVAEAAAAVRTTIIGRSPAVDGEPPREQLRRRRSTGMASTSPSLLTGTSPRDGYTAPRRLGCRRFYTTSSESQWGVSGLQICQFILCS